MKSKIRRPRFAHLIPLLCLLWSGTISPAPAQGIFEATVGLTPGGGLLLGKFYFRVEDQHVDFVALTYPTGWFGPGLAPKLLIPGNSLDFSLGNGDSVALHGSHTVANHNPFLPAEPWLPSAYDESGISIYLDTMNIQYGILYSGQFDLPPGFLDELQAGNGSVQFSPALAGQILSVPEPSTGSLIGLAIVILLFIRRLHRGRAS